MRNTPTTPTIYLDRYLELVQHSVHPTCWEAIARNPTVRQAHETLVRLTQKEPEKNHYGLTARLLNFLSIAVFDVSKDARTTEDRDHAFVFCSNHDIEPRGDLVDTNIKPDYPSYIGTREELELAASNENHVRRDLSFCELGSVAEQCWRRNGTPMLGARLTALKRHRPDLPTVQGFSIHRGRMQLSQVSATGIWSSRPIELSAIEPWIAFVVLVYQSYDVRDRRLVYNNQQVEFTRWDLRLADSDSQPPIILAPFYLRKPFGVTTFAAFQVPIHPDPMVAFHEEEVRGVWKSSWQHVEDISTERGLLERLHKGGWMPGLVRLYPVTEGEQRLVVPTAVDIVQRAADQDREDREHVAAQLTAMTGLASLPGDPEGTNHCDAALRRLTPPATLNVKRTIPNSIRGAFLPALPDGKVQSDTLLRETLHLASVGEPLSQCESPCELLEVMYDLLETHIHMWEEGILHRDVTWFNVLCKAKHFVGNDAGQKARPSINAILHDLANGGSEVEYRRFKSSVLLIDLDNSVTREELEADAQAGFYPNVGTPGFIACDLAHPHIKSRDSTGKNTQMLHRLLGVLDVERLPHGATALSRAFPKGDGDFMANFRKICQLEATNSSRVDWPKTRPIHKPRHDAESIFWVFFYAFVRTRPRLSPADEDTGAQILGECYDLLQQDPKEYMHGLTRQTVLTNSHPYLGDYLHHALEAFGQVLGDIAFYLSLPWCRYESIISPDHAHVALRRIILHYILTLDSQILDIPLDTERPRACPGNCWFSQSPSPDPLAAPKSDSCDEPMGGSTRMPSPCACACAPPAKRKAAESEPCHDDPPRAKRTAAGDGALPSSSTYAEAQDDAMFASPAPCGQQDRSLARSASEYRHDLHADKRSAHAMRLKVWKDRHWFTCRPQ